MAGFDFIKLYHTLDEALTVEGSIYDNIFYRKEIQLLPNNPLPYIQRTSNDEGIEVEDWNAYLVNVCTGSEVDITAYFEVDNVFFDDNGTNQIQWRLTNIPLDYGFDYVYLKIDQLGQNYFSNPFLLTELESEKTTRFDYGNFLNQDMQSIQLRLFFRQNLKDTELGSYNEISTSTTVTVTTTSSKFQKWVATNISYDTLIQVSDIFECIYTFVNLKKANLYKPIEINEVEGGVNSYFYKPIYLSFEGLTYDPLFKPSNYSSEHYDSQHYST